MIRYTDIAETSATHSTYQVVGVYILQIDHNWQAKPALSGEVDGKLCIAAHAVCNIYVPYVQNSESRDCTEDFTDST